MATGAEFSLPWDGAEYPIEGWNRDQTLRSAFSVSCVWFHQELARRVGQQRMERWEATIHYGNENISGGLTNFWLSGSLAISADEQVQFLQRLHTSRLPFSARSIDAASTKVVQRVANWRTIAAKNYLWIRARGRILSAFSNRLPAAVLSDFAQDLIYPAYARD